MSAHHPAPADAAIRSEIGATISTLFDAQARQRIANAWMSGALDGDCAMELLVTLDLIEVPHG